MTEDEMVGRHLQFDEHELMEREAFHPAVLGVAKSRT